MLITFYFLPWILLVVELPELMRKYYAPPLVWSAEFIFQELFCSALFLLIIVVSWGVFWYFCLHVNNSLDYMRSKCHLELLSFVTKSGSIPLSSHLDFIQCLTNADAHCSIFGITIDTKLCLLHMGLVAVFVGVRLESLESDMMI
jgi:hypothetical protein